jgi:hypothetical protein
MFCTLDERSVAGTIGKTRCGSDYVANPHHRDAFPFGYLLCALRSSRRTGEFCEYPRYYEYWDPVLTIADLASILLEPQQN